MRELLTIIHVLTGTLALAGGLLALLSTRGSRQHRLGGRIFVWSMYVVCIAAMMIHLPEGRYFLPAVAVFSLYLVYTGSRAFRVARQGEDITDKLVVWLGLFFAVLMIGWSTAPLWHGSGMLNVVLLAMGLALGGFSLTDLRRRSSEFSGNRIKRFHLQRMGGGYIAAITALLVVNGDQWAERLGWSHAGLLMWTLPSVIGTWLIVRASSALRD